MPSRTGPGRQQPIRSHPTAFQFSLRTPTPPRLQHSSLLALHSPLMPSAPPSLSNRCLAFSSKAPPAASGWRISARWPDWLAEEALAQILGNLTMLGFLRVGPARGMAGGLGVG